MKAKLIPWLELHLWPWRKIALLRNEIARLVYLIDFGGRSYEQGRLAGLEEHWYEWLAKAQTHCARKFDGDERVLLRNLYDKGFTWRQALARWHTYMQESPRYVAMRKESK